MNSQKKLRSGIQNIGLECTDAQFEQLYTSIVQLQKWNAAFNLTAIRDESEMVVLHLLDSLVVAPHLASGDVLDVGTGPGFPGIPLAIMNPHQSFYLLDSNGKKTRYMRQLVHLLALENVSVLDTRVEQWQPKQKFDVIISRAFASLETMLNLTDHLVKESGCWQAMKGEVPYTELEAITANYQVTDKIRLSVPMLNAERHLITIKKQTTEVKSD